MMDKLHDLLGKLQKIREEGPMDKQEGVLDGDDERARQDLENSLNQLYSILTTITHDDQSDVFQSEAEELMAEELIGTIAEFKARIEGDVGSFDDPDDPSDRKVVTDPETGKPKWSDESIGEHDATDDKENQNLGRFVTQTLLKKDLLKTDKYPEDMIGKFIEHVLRRYESKVTPEQDESVKMSHVGKDVDQTLSYDNWLKQKKGILRGARGITGPEHNKFAKEYRASKKK